MEVKYFCTKTGLRYNKLISNNHLLSIVYRRWLFFYRNNFLNHFFFLKFYRTTSLPNFVGTFVQPHFVLSSQGMKQLVFDSDSLILPDQIKVENGFINGSIVTAAENGVTSSTGLLQDEKPTIANDGTSQIIVDNDNFVTLHIGEDENMVVNDYEPFSQNEDISKLFKQVSVSQPAFQEPRCILGQVQKTKFYIRAINCFISHYLDRILRK